MRNLRKHILIHPGFQLRFAFFFTATVLTFSMIFPVFSYFIFDAIERHPLFEKFPLAKQALHEAQADLKLFLIALVLFTLVAGFLISLFHSHKIAGPLYKLRMAMIAMQHGVLDHQISFRTKDNFHELAHGFNEMIDAVFIRRRKDFENVQSVIPKLERLQSKLLGEELALTSEVLTALKELSQNNPLR